MLDWHIKGAFKKIFIAKRIYMDISNGHINERLANLVINKQILTCDKNNLLYYKSIYPMLKTWLVLKLWHSYLLQ